MPAPTGGVWRISTICGSRKLRNGIPNNALYAGRIVLNRQRFVRNPVTRKRGSRPNPESDWKVRDVPELRIVDGATWAAVAALENAPEPIAGVRRVPSKRLLSGLIRCGTCGGAFTVVGAERWGCNTVRSAGTCAGTRTLSLARRSLRTGCSERCATAVASA